MGAHFDDRILNEIDFSKCSQWSEDYRVLGAFCNFVFETSLRLRGQETAPNLQALIKLKTKNNK